MDFLSSTVLYRLLFEGKWIWYMELEQSWICVIGCGLLKSIDLGYA